MDVVLGSVVPSITFKKLYPDSQPHFYFFLNTAENILELTKAHDSHRWMERRSNIGAVVTCSTCRCPPAAVS